VRSLSYKGQVHCSRVRFGCFLDSGQFALAFGIGFAFGVRSDASRRASRNLRICSDLVEFSAIDLTFRGDAFVRLVRALYVILELAVSFR